MRDKAIISSTKHFFFINMLVKPDGQENDLKKLEKEQLKVIINKFQLKSWKQETSNHPAKKANFKFQQLIWKAQGGITKGNKGLY